MSFREWFEDADMPMRRDDGTWYDAETGISFSASSEAAPYRIQYNPSADVQGYRDYAKQFGGKALTGSPKQKDWAEKIRAEKLAEAKDHAGVDVLARSKLFSSAKFWIENRTEKGGVLAEYATNYLAVMRMMQKLADTAVAIQRKEKTNIITTAKPVYALHEKYMRELGKSESNIKLLTEQIVSAALNESSVLITQFADIVKAMNQPQAKPQPYSVQDAIEETIKALLLKLEESDDPIAQLGTSIQLMDAIQQRDIHQQHDPRVARFIVRLSQERIPEIEAKVGDGDLLDSAQALLSDLKAITKSNSSAQIQILDGRYSRLINSINATKGFDSIGDIPDAPDLTTKRQYFTKKEAFTSHKTDRLAHEAATSPYNDLTEPTLEQKISGDYAKGHLVIAGMPIAIENPQRSVRSGTDTDGTEWSITMKTHYGYFEGTKGADGDEVDVILMPCTEPDFSGDVYVIAQNNPKTGEFDEHKVVLGAIDKDQAIEAYHANYSDDWQGFGSVKAMSMGDFQDWLKGAPDRMMFDGIGGDIRLVTEQDIQADPLAVLDLCVGVLEQQGATESPAKNFFLKERDSLTAEINSGEISVFKTKIKKARIEEITALLAQGDAAIEDAFLQKTSRDVYNANGLQAEVDDRYLVGIVRNGVDLKSIDQTEKEFMAILGRMRESRLRIDGFYSAGFENYPFRRALEKFEKSNPQLDQAYKRIYPAFSTFLNTDWPRSDAQIMQDRAAYAEAAKTTATYERSRQRITEGGSVLTGGIRRGRAFDSIASELDAITDQDIESDPLAVLDLCVGVLEESTDAITPTGRTNPVKTAKGTKIGTQFAVVEVEKLITSHDSAGNENPAFPQELQPRDRGRDASRAWVAKTANSLDNDSLGRTSRADSGAPIVGRDGIVESGNGRTMAIRMAYDQGTADEYRQFLIDDADYFGIDPDQVERMKRPVLVRVRTTETDRRVFTVEANQDDKLALSATERARSDAKRLDKNMLALFKPDENGSLLTASNHKFIQAFLASLGDAEAAQYVTSGGKPTRALVDRIRAAVFSKAYNDDRLLEMMADDANPDLQNVLNALGAASSKFIEAQAFGRTAVEDTATAMVDGIEQSLDERVTNAVIEATNTLLSARANNQDVTEYVRQQGLFEDIDDGVAALAVFLAQNSRSAKRMAIAFKAMAEYVKDDAISQANNGLFGEPVPPSLIDVVAAANIELTRQYGDDSKNIGLFDSYLADGRYDHIHLDDLQMHPYANAAKERQPTAKTPLLVQKNRRGDLYLIAGVKRYEMALDDDVEYLPAVILPVIEGYGDPVIKRVLNTYTGSIDPLALMAAIEDAVIERADKSLIS